MKLPVFLLLVVLASPGCKKKEEAAAPPLQVAGEKVELPVLEVKKTAQGPSSSDNEAEVQRALGQARYDIRYENYASARAELDKISASPNLTADQRGAINKTIEQLNNAIKADPRTAH